MCKLCSIGKRNLDVVKSEPIPFGEKEFSIDLLFGISEDGKGNMRAVLFDNWGEQIGETRIEVLYCPMCGRELG